MIRADGDATLIDVKAVPGARRDQIVGPLGERLKIRVSAPPEDGKANKAICALVARTLAVRPNSVEVVAGHANPHKTVRVAGLTTAELTERLGLG